MATLKELLAGKTISTSLDFRNNDKPSIDADGKEIFWAYAWVKTTEGILLCIGATVDTLKKIEDNPMLDTLMLTQPEARVNSSNGLEYDLCQLFIGNTFKISDSYIHDNSTSTAPSNDKIIFKTKELSQKLTKSMFLGAIIAVLVGYLFSNELYFKKGNEISFDTYANSFNKNSIIIKESFNYKFAILTFSLVSGLIFFGYFDENRKFFLLKKINFFTEKFDIKKKTQKLSLFNVENNLFLYFKTKLFNFKGRISRSDFLGEILSLNLISYFFLGLLQNKSSLFFQIIFLIIYLFFLVKINVRRLHDFNLSGWYTFFSVLPVAIFYLCLIIKFEFLIGFVLSTWNLIFGVIILSNLLLLFTPGNKYTNSYGQKK